MTAPDCCCGHTEEAGTHFLLPVTLFSFHPYLCQTCLSEIIYWALTLVFAGPRIPVISHTHTPTPTPNLAHSRGLRQGIVCAFSLDHKPLPLAWSVFCSVWVFPPRTPILRLHPLNPPETPWSCQRSCRRRAVPGLRKPAPHGWLGAPGLPKRSCAPVLAEVPQEQHVPLSFT